MKKLLIIIPIMLLMSSCYTGKYVFVDRSNGMVEKIKPQDTTTVNGCIVSKAKRHYWVGNIQQYNW